MWLTERRGHTEQVWLTYNDDDSTKNNVPTETHNLARQNQQEIQNHPKMNEC